MPESQIVVLTCPQCGQQYRASEEKVARLIAEPRPCKKCGQAVRLVAESATASAASNPLEELSGVLRPNGRGAAASHRPANPYDVAAGPAEIASAAAAPPTVAYASGRGTSELRFEGAHTPNISLLEGERVIGVFEAGMADLGLLGSLFGYKRRMVLTNLRLFSFDKQIVTNALDIVWLERVDSALIGQAVIWPKMIAGAFFVGLAVLNVLSAAGNLLTAPGRVGPGDLTLTGLLSLIFGGIGFLLMFFARRKLMMARTGGHSAGIVLTRLASEESRRFADLIFDALHRLRPNTATARHH